MKIAVFGNELTVNRFISLSKEKEGVDILPLIYTFPDETAELIERAFNCDIYVFTNPLSYLIVKEKIEKKRLPVVQVSFDAFMIAAALNKAHREASKPIHRIGIDIVPHKNWESVWDDLDIDEENVHIFFHRNDKELNTKEIVQHYEELWQNQKLEQVFTISEDIYGALKAKQVPVHLIEIPNINIIQALEKAITRAKLQHNENNQIVTGTITTKAQEDFSLNSSQLEKIREILLRFTDKTNCSFIQSNNSQFIITGTDKLLDHLKNHYREFPLLQQFISQVNVPVFIGFGLGLNAKESFENAQLALDYCKRSEYSICYIVNERQETIGPIGIKKDIDTSSLYHALIHRAKLNNELSYNFINFIKERNNEPFSSNDVALFYNVTKRSAERTVSKLLNGEVVKVAGEERPYTKGRPRKLFKLNL